MTQGTPASSQIIWLEGRVKELEAQTNICGSGAGCLHKEATIDALREQVAALTSTLLLMKPENKKENDESNN